MPQSYYNISASSEPAGLGLNHLSNACPNPLTPPAEEHDHYAPVRLQSSYQTRVRSAPSPNNTAAGMAQSQEDSIYLSPAATPESVQNEFGHNEGDKMDVTHEECKDGTKTPMVVNTYEAEQSNSSPSSPVVPAPFTHGQYAQDPAQRDCSMARQQTQTTWEDIPVQSPVRSDQDKTMEHTDEAFSKGLAPVDLLFQRSTITQPWNFSNRRLLPEYPSHVFQSFSRYTGTQQSDRQIYNVDVTILTVDIAQCTMSGYLLIRGLTPEHDTLQTYFTGEIIGGPPRFSDEDQHYTFRTANPGWGATEKTDLQHWARFPAWRSLSSHAKRDINFAYPTDGGHWWEQENIFMRWKEHFLVPDHKTRSIAGASFEGFYYICLNQVQGSISGIYYHSKSEKYQQLELKHEGKPDVFNRGVTPCVEFR